MILPLSSRCLRRILGVPMATGASRTPIFDLPAGLQLSRVLSQSERGMVALVKRGGQHLVLRVGGDVGDAVAAEVALFARLRDPGLVPPLEWGRTPEGRPYLLRRHVGGKPFAE